MNDVTRQVAGALGTAVIGSLITSFYGANVADSIAGLPAEAGDSIGQTNAIAAQLPVDEAARLMDSAADAFTSALASGFLIAGAIAAVAAVVAKLWLPARHRAALVVPDAAIAEAA
jgi:hypothetical protein